MPLILASETQMVRDTAHEFFRERAPITALRKLRDANDPDGFSRSLWREMAELGWTGFLVPEDFGGTEFGVLGLAQVMEAAGRDTGGVGTGFDRLGWGVAARDGRISRSEVRPFAGAGLRRTAVRAGAGGGIAASAVQYRNTGGSSWRGGTGLAGKGVCPRWTCRGRIDRRGADSAMSRWDHTELVPGDVRGHAPTHDHDRQP